MKKIVFLLIVFNILINITACSGYKPIFSSSNLDLEIVDYSIRGDKKIGNKIYSKLYNLSKSSQNTSNTKNIYLIVESKKNKNPTAKDSAGKILGYKINLLINITIKDLASSNQLLSENFNSSLSYKVQSQHSETIKLENESVENLVNKIYQDFLIKLSENIL